MKQAKLNYANRNENSVNNSPMSLTLREMRAFFCGPLFWILVGCAIFITTIAGPYFTLERFSFPERLVFWGTSITLPAIFMSFLSTYAQRLIEAHRLHWSLGAIGAGVFGALPMTLTVYLAEGITTGFSEDWTDLASFASIALGVAPTLIAVNLVITAIFQFQRKAQTPSAATPANLTLVQSKLPPRLGHDIICVQAQDHYVEVTTPKGRAMILMRLSDAAQDLEPLGGMQVHRSWWVRLGHIERMEKGKNGPEIMLTSGRIIPVGRNYRASLRAALS